MSTAAAERAAMGPPSLERRRPPRALGWLRTRAAALLVAAAALAQGCSFGWGQNPRRPDEGGAQGPGASVDDPILVSRLDDELLFIQAQSCTGGGHPVVGDDMPLYSGQRRCVLDRIEGSCGNESRAFYFLLCE